MSMSAVGGAGAEAGAGAGASFSSCCDAGVAGDVVFFGEAAVAAARRDVAAAVDLLAAATLDAAVATLLVRVLVTPFGVPLARAAAPAPDALRCDATEVARADDRPLPLRADTSGVRG